MNHPIASLLAIAAVTGSLAAQTSFDVASIKPMKETDDRVMIRQMPGGRFTASGVSLRLLIGIAYDVRDFQISGGPGWMSSDRYEINAVTEGTERTLPPEKMRELLRALLAERFQLKTHDEEKELPVYNLVVAKGGPKLKESEVPAGNGPRPQMVRIGRGQISGKGMPMNLLTQQLAQNLGRPVIDKTELKGRYDIEMEWAPDPGQGGLPGVPGPPDGGAAAGDASGPTLYTALQEKLGLKLEPAKGPVRTLVIDSAAKPTEN